MWFAGLGLRDRSSSMRGEGHQGGDAIILVEAGLFNAEMRNGWREAEELCAGQRRGGVVRWEGRCGLGMGELVAIAYAWLVPKPKDPLRPAAVVQERDLIRLRREAKSKAGFFVEPEEKLLLVVRIRGINDVAPKTRKILQLLRLLRINSAVFVRVNRATLNMLQRVEPYIAYGYPNLKTVRELIYKRGFGKVRGSRIPLTDNAVVEAALGKHNIICVEDIIHEIMTVGPAFKEANNFLWPFKLSPAKGGISRKRVHFIEGGQAGNREHLINNFIRASN